MLPAQSTALADHTHARAQPLSVDTGALQASVYGTSTVAIDPDDAASAGVAATVSRSDHAHEFLTATAVALTKTATSSEGSSGDGARADHVHATDALPWGIVARQTPLTVNNGAHTTNATTDMAITNVAVDVLRAYEVTIKTVWLVSAGAYWRVNFHVDGTVTDCFGEIQTTVAEHGVMASSFLWLPATDTVDVDVRVVEVSAGGDLTLEGAAAKTRQFYIKDIGPR